VTTVSCPRACLINTLTLLLARHLDAHVPARPERLIDVLSLSLGYYHENPGDELMDGPLGALLRDFGRLGVAVVAAAGNATTIAPMYPAAFASQVTGFAPDQAPLASVGALNPDGSTVAYFSNAGTWVSTHRPGSSLVSTFPTDVTAAAQATARCRLRRPSPVDPGPGRLHRAGSAHGAARRSPRRCSRARSQPPRRRPQHRQDRPGRCGRPGRAAMAATESAA
jgi:hypothetical protein